MRKILVGVFAVVLVLGTAYFYMSNDNQKDKKVWEQLRNQLTAENIKEIRVDNTFLEKDEFAEFISLIRKSEFDKSNRVGHGPTPESIITIVFVDGIKIHVGFWGGTTFELSPNHIDTESQFLVTNDTLGDWISSTYETEAGYKKSAINEDFIVPINAEQQEIDFDNPNILKGSKYTLKGIGGEQGLYPPMR